MQDLEDAFAVPTATAGEEAFQVLKGRFRAREETASEPPAAGRTATYYDTFDWRIHKDGGILYTFAAAGGRVLVWKRHDGAVRHHLAIAAAPAFAWDLPAGAFRDELAPVVEMRRLLPLVELRPDDRAVDLLDDFEQPAVRVRLERRSAALPNGTPVPLPPVLRVVPMGDAKAVHRVVRFLAEELRLEPPAASELAAALFATGGRMPGDYSSKVKLALDPAMAAAEAARAVHRSLLATIRVNEDGVRRNLDSEFLHDFRVAVRRTRSALTQVKGVFPATAVDTFRGELSWLGSITGPTRDLDVYLLKMDSYRAALPQEARQDLALLGEFLKAHQRHEHARLAQRLDGWRYRRLLTDWQAFLDGRGGPRAGPAPNAERPIGELASERIFKVHRRILKLGRRIDDESPAQDLHRLRIEGKKLRYLMEFFRSLYEPAEIAPLIKALKQLQDNLGDFNDYQVQQESLRAFEGQMLEEKLATAATLRAMDRLVDRLAAGQAEERRRFTEHFAEFARKENRRRFRALFGAP